MSDRRLSQGLWLVLLVLVLPAACYAAPDTVWTFRYAGTAGGDYQPLTSFVDARSATGHVYVAGWAQQPTGGIDALLLKISADSGHLVWDKTYPDMTASGAAMDTSGNVYIAGVTTGATAAGKLCVLKYFPNGDTDWTRTYGEQGLSFTSVGTIALDDSQNVYACGRSDSEVRIVKYRNGLLAGVISYIPSSQMPLYGRGQFHILRGGGAYLAITCERQTGSGRYHWLIAKLSSQSQVLWERVYRDTSNSCEWVNWSQVDEDASIYLTGVATSAVYGTEDFRTIKMDSLGDTLWTREYIGPEGLRGVPRFLMLDKGSVYIAGWSMHHEVGAYQATALVKYDSLGSQQWASRYGTADDTDADVGYENIAEPTPSFCSIDADDSGNVYLTGYCLPGTDAVGILLQYDAQGNLVRERELSSPDERWFGATIAIDGTGSPYETGVHVRDNGYLELFVTKFRGRQR